MKAQHPKIKTQLFSCGFFRHCTRTVLSPTTPHPPPLPFSSTDSLPPSLSLDSSPPAPTQPDPPTHHPSKPESESSSSSTSQSFTQWKFALPDSPILPYPQPEPDPKPEPKSKPPPPPPISSTNLQELFHAAELQLSVGSHPEQLAALQLLERSLVPYPPPDPVCPPELMRGLVRNLKNKAGAKAATKILLALCLAEGNRHVGVEGGRAGAMAPAPAEDVARAVELALKGDCSGRGRRKGAQLLKALQEPLQERENLDPK
ncbi:PREDICTED: WAS/WASL-interacting protein family member 3 [Prunus mume]|uniref:WAS/WASL-interacting protein family member 3 n=1 Tax=Prunus mume TaxID=102107 RepID=A0ABM0N650_PRUMU|nr:PREDICTED: WAS/WASL-interacting protein family member 3 [Prunus mume]